MVEDEKEANRLHNKGFFGEPLSGGGLELDLHEAIYLLEAERLEIEDEEGGPISKEAILERTSEERFMKEYLPYKDMRLRGYVLKKASDPASYRVFPRGGGPGQTPSKYWLCTHSEKGVFDIKEILDAEHQISNLDKTMLTAVVDEEGDVTYYKFSTIDLNGSVERFDEKKLEATMYGDRCMIDENFEGLLDSNFYGFEDNGVLRLSSYETLYLKENEIMAVKDIETEKYLTSKELKEKYTEDSEGFELKYEIYEDLRRRGLIPKTGFKYGTPFRAYADDPDGIHAEYIIQPVGEDRKYRWYEVSRAVRVAHSVRKDFLFAYAGEEDVEYLKIKRETP
ncbi:MAG: tRNA-intron lyase [Candidatus Thermoplasmatota archaeon]|nr:tRNA-intron lyase [Candidatus Thermoplasmatota archaeon]